MASLPQSNQTEKSGMRCRIFKFVLNQNSSQSLLFFLLPTLQQIFIKTLTGRKQAFNFEPENQVLAVKQALQEKEGIQVDQIRLIFSGKQLSDDRSLESYSINAGATIHMVLQLRGGCKKMIEIVVLN